MTPAATILIIDDSLEEQGELGAILATAGYGVIGANSTRDAIVAVTERCVDLVLLDATAPKFKDLEFLQLLREDLKWLDLPVIVLADELGVERIGAITPLGVSLCLAKSPTVLEQLPSIVSETLNAERK